MMKIDEAKTIIEKYSGSPVRIMEVCGTHTHEIFRYGIRKILSPNIELISGPGCPVCVTPNTYIDEAIELATCHHVTICTFGDLMRVPGSEKSLMDVRREGAEIKVMYAPFDSLEYAMEHPEKEIVFLSVGFETTTPSICLAVKHAQEMGIMNFSILAANKTMSNVYKILKKDVDIFLYPGHVHAITGEKIAKNWMKENISGVITGFTVEELMDAIACAIKEAEKKEPFFLNCYSRVVKENGNIIAQNLMHEVMQVCDSNWRGLGIIKNSGLMLSQKYQTYDARKKYQLAVTEKSLPTGCRCGEVLQGKILPKQCPLFGKICMPDHPVGACMVSQEGACAAYYQYGGK